MLRYDKHIQIALSSFLAAAALGLLLRFTAVHYVDFIYRYVIHAHSHVAILGWVYLALITLITKYFLHDSIPKKVYRWIFGTTLVSIIGMLATFPFQGYAVLSIIFSTLFLFASYFYAWAFFKYTPKELKSNYSYKVLKYAIIYMVVSSIGPWAIGAVMATLGPTSPLYHSSIYLYLHFQYNAWMILGIIGILLRFFELNNISIDKGLFRKFLVSFHISVILTYLLSILFIKPPSIIYVLTLVGSLLQIGSFVYFYHAIIDAFKEARPLFMKNCYGLFKWGFILLIVKLVMQLMGSFPHYAEFVVNNKFLTIGFIHMVFLGVVTLPLFALLKNKKLIYLPVRNIRLYVIGFLATELMIFYLPSTIMYGLPTISPQPYNLMLFFASVILVLSIANILFSQFKKRKLEDH